MNYHRTIPRDLFNEAGLLKCHGQLYLNLERLSLECMLHHDGAAFEVEQSPDDGSIELCNVRLTIRHQHIRLWRPLNARRSYALYATAPDVGDDMDVFNEDGTFTEEFLAYLGD